MTGADGEEPADGAGGTSAHGPVSLLHELLAVQDAERDRIFAGLHDDTVQVLAALGLRIGVLRRSPLTPEQDDELADVARELAAAGRRLRLLVADSDPEALAERGLRRALEDLLVSTVPAARHRLDVPDLADLDPATARVLYEIAVEALRNVARHAGATAVALTLTRADDWWELVVRDDGVGVGEAPDGIGRRSMRNRAQVASGTLDVAAADDRGTTVTARIPRSVWTLDPWDADVGRRDMRAAVDAILHGVSDAFIALDREWRFVYLNERAAEYYGRAVPDLLGRNIWEVYPEGVGQTFYHAYHRAMRDQRSLQVEEHFAPWDRWYENRIIPSPHGLTIFFTDVTDRHRLREGRTNAEFAAQASDLWTTHATGDADARAALTAAARACVEAGLAQGVSLDGPGLRVVVGDPAAGDRAELVVGGRTLGTLTIAWDRPNDEHTARVTRRAAQVAAARLAPGADARD